MEVLNTFLKIYLFTNTIFVNKVLIRVKKYMKNCCKETIKYQNLKIFLRLSKGLLIKMLMKSVSLDIEIIGSKPKVFILGTELLAWNSSPDVGQRLRGVTPNRNYQISQP